MWLKRAARARELAERYPATREILLFYAGLAEWQATATGSPEQLLPELVELVLCTGPAALQEAARGLTRLPELHAPPPLDFFARAARQPSAISQQCPECGKAPQAGCLRPEGDGLALELVCSLCFGRSPFPRARCPACGESGEGRLVFYSAPEFVHLRIQACETCRAYLQLVDLSREPAAIPEVDELAGLPLDLWAQHQGYHKIHRNLAGV
ncbi:MAG: formate dehydrogenase accessory protein FdhE [Acidobacteria bacterium]|nr:formate dehydrogenase accessory protein FdhE [Acidobacteriota bacterium]